MFQSERNRRKAELSESPLNTVLQLTLLLDSAQYSKQAKIQEKKNKKKQMRWTQGKNLYAKHKQGEQQNDFSLPTQA